MVSFKLHNLEVNSDSQLRHRGYAQVLQTDGSTSENRIQNQLPHYFLLCGYVHVCSLNLSPFTDYWCSQYRGKIRGQIFSEERGSDMNIGTTLWFVKSWTRKAEESMNPSSRKTKGSNRLNSQRSISSVIHAESTRLISSRRRSLSLKPKSLKSTVLSLIE